MMGKQCPICGNTTDLYLNVSGDKVCSICLLRHITGFRGATPDAIKSARSRLGLKDGEFLEQDLGKEAAKFLGRS